MFSIVIYVIGLLLLFPSFAISPIFMHIPILRTIFGILIYYDFILHNVRFGRIHTL